MKTSTAVLSVLVGLACSSKLPFGPGFEPSDIIRFDVIAPNHRFQEAELKDHFSRSAVTGSYTFTAPNGQTFNVCYVADENGYRTYPIGAEETCDFSQIESKSTSTSKPTTTTTPTVAPTAPPTLPPAPITTEAPTPAPVPEYYCYPAADIKELTQTSMNSLNVFKSDYTQDSESGVYHFFTVAGN